MNKKAQVSITIVIIALAISGFLLFYIHNKILMNLGSKVIDEVSISKSGDLSYKSDIDVENERVMDWAAISSIALKFAVAFFLIVLAVYLIKQIRKK